MANGIIETTLKEEVLSKYKNSIFVETGTAHGGAVKLALKLGFKVIYSIELEKERYEYNCNQFKSEIASGQVVLINGDSLEVMNSIISYLYVPATFWLDAHVDDGPCGKKKCPLYDEIDIIGKSNIKKHTLLIDDLRIFGGHWGEGISEGVLRDKIKQINPAYQFAYENGWEPNDILAAYVS